MAAKAKKSCIFLRIWDFFCTFATDFQNGDIKECQKR